VQRFRQARRAPGEAPPDWLVFQDVARAVQAMMPAVPAAPSVAKKRAKARAAESAASVAVAAPPTGWDYVISSDIADEISTTVNGYRGTSYTSLELTGKSWGRQPNEAFYYDGTSYENTEGVGVQLATMADDGKSVFQLAFREPAAPAADEAFPLTLLLPARAYDGGEWMRGSKLLNRLAPPHAILSLADAQRLGLAIGETVRITSAAGSLDLPATIDAGLAAGLVLVPHFKAADLSSVVTGPQTRVAVSKL
jgi:NADH-quinone oxidoreductase subunit G